MLPFKFTPKKEEELSELLAEGDAGFEILDVVLKYSQAGKPMLVLKNKIWDLNGDEGVLDDFIVLEESSKFSMRKLKHLCDSVGLTQLYEMGQLDNVNIECFKNQSGKLRLGVQKNRKDKNGNPVRDKNVVWDYLVQENTIQTQTLKDDDIPDFK